MLRNTVLGESLYHFIILLAGPCKLLSFQYPECSVGWSVSLLWNKIEGRIPSTCDCFQHYDINWSLTLAHFSGLRWFILTSYLIISALLNATLLPISEHRFELNDIYIERNELGYVARFGYVTFFIEIHVIQTEVSKLSI